MILIIDHFDSFVHTLARYVAEAGYEVEVVRQNMERVEDILALKPDAVIFSPGPGRPETTGISRAVLEAVTGKIPVLGVCLGHQLIVNFFGGQIERSDPVHGSASAVTHNDDRLFAGIASPFAAGRYHSLAAYDLPDCLEEIAWGPDKINMAVRHKAHEIYGVQFHPESVLTPNGRDIIGNFLHSIPKRTQTGT